MEDIEQYDNELQHLKRQFQQTAKHISWNELLEPDKFQRLATGRKRLLDTIKMIAYRAETAMVRLVTNSVVDSTAGRGLIQDVIDSQADILPETANHLLKIRIHRSARPATDRLITTLFERLNQAELVYPGAELKLAYELHRHDSSKSREHIT